jgi:hypothetical protein
MYLGGTSILLGVKFGNLVNFLDKKQQIWLKLNSAISTKFAVFRGRIHQIFNLTEIEKISLNSLFASLSEASIKLHLAQEDVRFRLGDQDFVLRGVLE